MRHRPAVPFDARPACHLRSRPPPTPPPFRSLSPPGRHGPTICAASCPSTPGSSRRPTVSRPSPGKCLTLPAPDGKIAQVLFGLEDESSRSRDLFRPGALPGLLPPGVYRFANAPHDLRLATLAFALGTLSLRPLPQERSARRPPGAARRHRHRRYRADGGGRGAGARPDQYAVERHGPGRTGAGGAAIWRRGSARSSTASSATISCSRIFR